MFFEMASSVGRATSYGAVAPSKAFSASTETIDALARRLHGILQSSGTDANAPLEIAARLRTEPFRILVIGEFSRGKSTFLNALVGEKLLPSSVRPTTSVISVIRHGDTRCAVVHWRDRSRPPESIDLPEGGSAKCLDEVVTAKNAGSNDIAKVEITLPLPHLGLPFEFVDTPGVNDIDTVREEVTYSYLSRADAAVMLLDLQQPLSASEQRFLIDKVMSRDVRRILFVVNKVDQVPPETRDRAIRYIRESLAKIDGCRDAQILPISSKLAMQAKLTGDDAQLQASLFPEFERRLVEFLMHASGAPRIGTAASRLCRLALEHQQGLERAVTALEGDQAEILRSVGAAESGLAASHARAHSVEQSVELALARYLTEAQRNVHACLGAIRREAAAITRLPDFPNEAYIEQLRTVLNNGLRQIVQLPAAAAERAACAVLPRTPLLAPGGDADRRLEREEARFAIDLAMPAAETDPAASHLGGIVGGFIGAALLGPFGSIPFAMLGGWLGSVFGAKPPAQRIEATLSKTLSEIEERAQAVLEASANELRARLHEQVLVPERQSVAQHHNEVEALRRSCATDAATRQAQARSVRARLGDIQEIVLELRALGGRA